MRTIVLKTINLFFLMGTIVWLSACGDPEPSPSNEIKDSQGIKIDLDWTTTGSTNDALTDADLDLYVYKGGVEVLASEASFAFERITFDPNLYADGEYTIKVYSFKVSKNANYVVTVNGNSVDKPYEFTSNFVANDTDRFVATLTVTKTGNKYTVKQIS
jgi:hypothetical protein